MPKIVCLQRSLHCIGSSSSVASPPMGVSPSQPIFWFKRAITSPHLELPVKEVVFGRAILVGRLGPTRRRMVSFAEPRKPIQKMCFRTSVLMRFQRFWHKNTDWDGTVGGWARRPPAWLQTAIEVVFRWFFGRLRCKITTHISSNLTELRMSEHPCKGKGSRINANICKYVHLATPMPWTYDNLCQENPWAEALLFMIIPGWTGFPDLQRAPRPP